MSTLTFAAHRAIARVPMQERTAEYWVRSVRMAFVSMILRVHNATQAKCYALSLTTVTVVAAFALTPTQTHPFVVHRAIVKVPMQEKGAVTTTSVKWAFVYQCAALTMCYAMVFASTPIQVPVIAGPQAIAWTPTQGKTAHLTRHAKWAFANAKLLTMYYATAHASTPTRIPAIAEPQVIVWATTQGKLARLTRNAKWAFV